MVQPIRQTQGKLAHHKMKIDIITLFPNMFAGPFDESIIRRAADKGLVEIAIHNLRDWAIDDHGTVDDKPYGGGVGMVLRPEPIVAAIKSIYPVTPTNHDLIGSVEESHATESVERDSSTALGMTRSVILLSASGKLFNQQKALHLSRLSHLILICGHYEGVDQRIADYYVDEELSIGDYILTGGEIPAMVIVDSIVRLIPGVLSKEEAIKFESFSPTTKHHPVGAGLVPARTKGDHKGSPLQLLEHPHYTRPEEFEGHKVPEVLRSGHHKEIENWKLEEAHKRTKKNRPDFLTLKGTIEPIDDK